MKTLRACVGYAGMWLLLIMGLLAFIIAFDAIWKVFWSIFGVRA